MDLKDLFLVIFGFLFAQFFVSLGLEVTINGFKVEHLYVGAFLMLIAYVLDKKTGKGRWMRLFWFGLGIFINDFYLDFVK